MDVGGRATQEQLPSHFLCQQLSFRVLLTPLTYIHVGNKEKSLHYVHVTATLALPVHRNERKCRPVVLTLRVPEQSIVFDAAAKLGRKKHSLRQSQRKAHQKRLITQ